MRKRNRLAGLLFLSGVLTLSAQQSEINTYKLKEFDEALSLYRNSQYLSAQLIFDKVAAENTKQDLKADCAYYSATCAIRLEQPGADEQMESFIADYPASSKQPIAYSEVARYYFQQGKYPQALEWFEKVDEKSLSGKERDEYLFQKGYAYFSTGRKKEANDYLGQVVNSQEFGSQAKYYMGFMAYETDDYKEASKYFDEVSGEEKYKEKLSYFQADMNFKLGKFKEAIKTGEAAMAKSNAMEKSELNKIIGESYFNLGEYDKALPYLKEYKGKKGKWNNTDFYQLGYAYYKQGDYTNAIAQFNKIIDGKDSVAQNAYYHLGESYLKTNNKQQALNAFKNASEMPFDARIAEDAALNYARVSYDIGNSYQSVPEVLQAFLDKYPQSAARPELEGLLINSYITSKNYQGALALLEKNKGSNREAYQKVTFYRGLELYTDGKYDEALALFSKSLSEPKNGLYTARATFWKAETQFTLGDFKSAQSGFKDFSVSGQASATPEFKNLQYNIGYAAFKLKEYDAAATAFEAYTTAGKGDKKRSADAWLRLADCRFVTAKYWPAMDAYNKVIEGGGSDVDYAAYQKAISYGFVSKNDKKIEDLKKFEATYPKSQYRDDALFELGNTYVSEKKTQLAVAAYDELLRDYPTGNYNAKAVLRQGLVYYNNDNDEQALLKFKKVAADYPNSAEAQEAVATARLIYVDSGRVSEYAAWVRGLSFVEVSDAELDNDSFEAAEKQYQQNNEKAATTQLAAYVSQFPNGLHSVKANFYLGQLYFKQNAIDNAAKSFQKVADAPRGEFTEQALVRLSEIALKKQDPANTVVVLKKLESAAEYPQNITFAQANLMKTYYEQKDFPNAVIYAEKVLANPKTEDKVKSDAQIIIARSAWLSGDEAKAKSAYATLQTIAKGELAAEALYYDAYFKSKEGKYDLSNAAVQKLAKDYSSYKYFGAKGLVVMAKNFYNLKDSYQATYILDNVIKNFTAYPDVTEEAQTELTRIRTEEAKTNSSIRQ
ncbi:tetratricopeptide repeat protein [Flavobacterium silvaticum]|uniref:Tetratricopeptide repeat protein n=1 Tax=Flavobacterium silvaticum TaxID=1852020 RepID=A0A972JH23_9FLAO|nr:tetratricopeptide repeat protein [Flavobacterium silvaticum]NMH26668.1 tetratricopeptide repeat protein [Flavobacterium silvaticum]